MSRKDMIKSRKPKATKEAPISPAIPAAPKRVAKPAKEKTKASAGRRVLSFLKKAVPCTSSGAKHHVDSEEPVQDVSNAIEVAVIPRPVKQESSKAVSPISPTLQVSNVREVTVAPRSVKKVSFKEVSPKPHVADCEKTTYPVASGSAPTSGNGGGPVLDPVGFPAPKSAPLPTAQGDPSTVNGGSSYKHRQKIDIYDMGYLGGTKGEYIAMPENLQWTMYVPPPELKMALAAQKSEKAPAPIAAAVKPAIASSSTSTPLRKTGCKKPGPTVRFLSTIDYQTLSALKEADESPGEKSSSSTPVVDSASPSTRDSESEPSESSATPVNADSPITPEPDVGAKAESDIVEEVSTHTAAVPQDVDGDNDNLSKDVLHLNTQAESEEVEEVPTHTDVIVVGNDSDDADEIPHSIAQAECEGVEEVLLHTTAGQVADDHDEDVSTVRRQSYGSLLRFITQVEAEDLEARTLHAAAVADDDSENNEASTSRRNSYDSCLSMLERYFEKPWTPSNRRISGQSFRSTQDCFFGEFPCAWSDSNSVVLPPRSEAGSESEDERPLYGNSDSESEAESVPPRHYDPSKTLNITVWDLMGSDTSDSDDDNEDPFLAFNRAEEPDVSVTRRHASRRLGVYGEDQLHARSLSLPVMSTARTPTGPRPLLLPMHVARREGSMQASSSFPSSSRHS